MMSKEEEGKGTHSVGEVFSWLYNTYTVPLLEEARKKEEGRTSP